MATRAHRGPNIPHRAICTAPRTPARDNRKPNEVMSRLASAAHAEANPTLRGALSRVSLPLACDGASRTRTGDLLGAIQALSQLSYSPAVGEV
jgi:hypothetical protein